MPRHVPPFDRVPLTQRIRDSQVAEAISAAAGTDEAPELLELSNIVHATIPLQPRPPLAISGYLPGTIGDVSPSVALNNSHVGIFGSGFRRAIVRVNWLKIINITGSETSYSVTRLDSPFTGAGVFTTKPSGYINAGAFPNGGVLLGLKNDEAAIIGTEMFDIRLPTNTVETVWGPWILNDGVIFVVNQTVNSECRACFGYEQWPAIREQPPAG